MINSNELRIGNQIKHKTPFLKGSCFIGPLEILEILKDSISVDPIKAPSDILGYDEIFGIELTSEILEKCGLYKSNYLNGIMPNTWHFKGEKENGVNFIHIDDYNKIWYVYADFEHDGQVSFEIQFLHQLQNHVFSNTGEELTYTP